MFSYPPVDWTEWVIFLIASAFLLAVILMFFGLIAYGAYKDVRKHVIKSRTERTKRQLANKISQLHLPYVNPQEVHELSELISYRFAALVWRDGQPCFASIFKPYVFLASEDAICLAGGRYFADHRAPVETCQCGFYSLGVASSLPYVVHKVHTQYRLYSLLQVQVSGTVFPGTKGYRAEHQEVLHVWLPELCAICRRRASVLAANEEIGKSILRDTEIDKPLVPVCRWHARGADVTLTPSDLANYLGTEFSWLS